MDFSGNSPGEAARARAFAPVFVNLSSPPEEWPGNIVDSKWYGMGIIVGICGNRPPLVYYRRRTIDTDLNDHRPANRIFDILGCDGTSHLHFPNAKSNVRYLSGSGTLVCLRRIPNEISE